MEDLSKLIVSSFQFSKFVVQALQVIYKENVALFEQRQTQLNRALERAKDDTKNDVDADNYDDDDAEKIRTILTNNKSLWEFLHYFIEEDNQTNLIDTLATGIFMFRMLSGEQQN